MTGLKMENGDSSLPRLNVEDPARVKKTSKVPIIVAVVAILVAISLAIALAVVVSSRTAPQTPPQGQSPTDKPQVCMTPGCVKASGLVLDGVDQSVDPCQNFYDFACGNWMKNNLIPESRRMSSTFVKLHDELAGQLKVLLEEPEQSDGPKALKDIKYMYRACLDEEKIEELGMKPLHDMLRKLNGWPMIDPTWDNSDFDLSELLLQLRLLNNKYIFSFSAAIDYKNSSTHILALDEFRVGLPSREYYLDKKYEPMVAAHKQYIMDVANFLNTSDTVEQDAQDIIDFETFVANISMTTALKRDPEHIYNIFTIAELYTNISDKFEWLPFINRMFSKVNYTFSESSELVVTSPEFIRQMVDKIHTTPNRTLANYVLWRFTANVIPNLPKSLQEIRQKFKKVVDGVAAQPERWKRCVGYTRYMGMASGRLFVSRHFKEEAKASALKMIAGVRQSFNELLTNVKWMNDKTRKVAEEKAAAISGKIGYPEWILNNTRLDLEYEGLLGKLDPGQYFTNHLNTLRFISHGELKEISKPVDKSQWGMEPAVVNAYYSETSNQIVFPAGILQPPFWQEDRPLSMNYGSIGSVIGHEITHGFDDTGRKFDKDGNLVAWWDPEVVKAFDEAKQCIVDQYNGYVVTQLNRTMNGENTQGENIADNGGMKQSYRAFQRWQAANGPGQLLPGLEQFTPNHLFFIAFSQTWCELYRDQSLKLAIEEGVHSPGVYRVIGTLSNSKEFSEAFKCPAGSPMNPVKKCSVW